MTKFALMLILLVSIFFLSGCVKTQPEISENITNVTNFITNETNLTNETNHTELAENLTPAKVPIRMCETDADCANSNYTTNKCIAAGNDTYCKREGHITCRSNSDCEASEDNYSLCTFPGTANSTCFILKEGVLPGWPMNCKTDSECDDSDASTKDICAIVNESYSFCAHVTQ